VALFAGISSAQGIIGYEVYCFGANVDVTGIIPCDASLLGVGVFDVGAAVGFPSETGIEDTIITGLLSPSISPLPYPAVFPESSITAVLCWARGFLRLFLKKPKMINATKARAITAPIVIPAIAPPDRLCFEEDVVDVFDDDIEEEAPVGEAPVVATEGVGVAMVETMNVESVVPTVTTEGGTVVDSGTPVVLTEADDAPSEPNAMSSWEV
jgi:hypothetical protein